MLKHTVGVRGGASVSTTGLRRSALSGGASAALRHGMFIDAQLTDGDDEGRHGWSVAFRVTF